MHKKQFPDRFQLSNGLSGCTNGRLGIFVYPVRKHHNPIAEFSFANLYCQNLLLSTLHKYTLTMPGIRYRLSRFPVQSYRFGYHNSPLSYTIASRFGFPFSRRYGRIQRKKPRNEMYSSVRKRHEEPIIKRKNSFGGTTTDCE